jgi:uncharacterized protein YkwD
MSKYATLSQQVIEEHNRLRRDPKSYIPLIEKEMTYLKGSTMYKPGSNCGLITNEGKAAYIECIEYLKKAKPMSELKGDSNLCKAAQDHADDIGPKGITDHTGSDGSQMSDRIERYVNWNISCGENISFDCHTAEDIIIQLIIDDGNLNRGHRENIFSHKFNYVGVGCATHTEYNICCVMDYVGELSNKKDGKYSKPYDLIYNTVNKNEQKKREPLEEDDFKDLKAKMGRGFVGLEENGKNYKVKVANGYGDYDDLDKDLKGKMNLKSTQPSQSPSGFEDDPDAPENAVSCNIKTIIKTVNGKSTKKIIKKYKLQDGSEETIEIEETCV